MAAAALTHQPTRPAVAAAPVAARWATPVLLAALLGLALALRLWGLTSIHRHPDENLYAHRADRMVETGDPNPRYFMNPSLLTYLIAGELVVARGVGPLAGWLRQQNDLRPSVVLARLNSAMFGVAGVALTFATGAALFDRRIGLLAAAFLAVSFLHVRDSHYGVNDVPSATLLLLSLYFDARLLRDPSPRWYALAGLAGGLATSTKYTAGFFFVPLLAAHWFAKRGSAEGPLSRAALLALALAGASSLAGYLLATPYTLLDFRTFSDDFREQFGLGGEPSWGQPSGSSPWLYLTTLLQGFGALPLLLALIGLISLGQRQRATAVLLLAFPVAYLAFFFRTTVFYPRLAMPLLPFCALLAGYGVSRLMVSSPVRWRTIGLVVLLGLALAQPIANDLRHNWLLQQTDTRVLATEWIAGLPRGTRLLVEEHSITNRPERLQIDPLEADPRRDELVQAAARGVRYVMINSFLYGRDEGRQSLRQLHQALEQEAELVASFSPGQGGAEVRFRKEDLVASPFWALEEYERLGPTIRIYALRPGGP